MPTLSIKGLKEEYQPYEPVNLTLKAPPSKSSISISVRDDFRRDCLYDDSNILTEMLLSSEIRGFVPQPGWYFEADDEEHRAALDLLMMTQGWRRFDWRSMAVAGAWDITQPAERAPILIGTTYKNVIVDFVEGEETNNEKEDEEEYPFSEDGRSPHEDDYYETREKVFVLTEADVTGSYSRIKGVTIPDDFSFDRTEEHIGKALPLEIAQLRDEEGNLVMWWVRSPERTGHFWWDETRLYTEPAHVSYLDDGSITMTRYLSDWPPYIRPALWVDLSIE